MAEKVNSTVYIVFVSLLLDLLAFTMILPLLPSLLEYYKNNDSIGLYEWLLDKVKYFQEFLDVPERFNSVLFGGFLGSMYSFLQFAACPIVGGISDVVGRKCVMITCLIGIMLSYVLWALSTNFAIFILARFLGGISKGNVSLSMAIITDVSSVKTRGIGMALIGIAFSLSFTVGPVIGALFAVWAKTKAGNWYVIPALFAVFLALSDLVFFTYFFKESLPQEKRAKNIWDSLKNAYGLVNLKYLFGFHTVTGLKPEDLKQLQLLGKVYFVYMFIYSGLEFTLTFLTHHVFKYTSMEQGWMFFFIGVTMALIQGTYVRKLPQHKTKNVIIYGLWLIIPSFVCVGIARERNMLILGLLLYAISTAMVVSCMTTIVSLYGSEQQKGTVMGIFRSLGALARASGPVVASIAFWCIGSSATYLIGSIGLLWPVLRLRSSMKF